MSSTIENIACPKCGDYASVEHNNITNENHIWCTECGYDSDDDDIVICYDDMNEDHSAEEEWDSRQFNDYDYYDDEILDD